MPSVDWLQLASSTWLSCCWTTPRKKTMIVFNLTKPVRFIGSHIGRYESYKYYKLQWCRCSDNLATYFNGTQTQTKRDRVITLTLLSGCEVEKEGDRRCCVYAHASTCVCVFHSWLHWMACWVHMHGPLAVTLLPIWSLRRRINWTLFHK